jgi:hypothetical protein
MKTLHEILALWPDRDAICAAIGRPRPYVNDLFRTDRSPTPKHDLALWRDAMERRLPVTLDEFIQARESSQEGAPKQEAAE